MSAPAAPAPILTARPSGDMRAAADRAARSVARRRATSRWMGRALGAAVVLTVLPLVAVLGYLALKGAGALTPAFFTRLPAPVGQDGGGMANAIVGSLVIVAGAAAIGLPLGIGAGIHLAEHPGTAVSRAVRFLADVLNGVPSILFGIFAWQFVVRPMGRFSSLAGMVALAAILLPLVARTTEDILRTVPGRLREAALALGYPRWAATVRVVLRTALPGVLTGALVGVARVAGESAPLLFTAFGNPFWSLAVTGPMAALPLQLFAYANSPYDAWHAQAWGAALTLVLLVAAITVLARAALRRLHADGR